MNSLILHRRRSIELQKWRSLSVSVFAAFSNSFSSSAVATRIGKTFTASYLVESLGFAPKLAESISRRVSFENKVNPDSVLSLFRSYGFTDSHISTVITNYPKLLLTEDAEKSIGPKLEFLKSRATSTSELTEIVSKVPKILGLKEGKCSSVYYDFVKEIVQADKHQNKSSLSHSSLGQGTRHENKIRNLLVLRDLGMPQNLLFSLLISTFYSLCGKERFEESLKKVVEMGFDPTTPKFVRALQVVNQMSNETTQEKIQVFERLGFTVDDVWALFNKFPASLSLSEKKILNSFETFQGLGFTRDEFSRMVKSHPNCLGYSVESVKMKTEFLVKKMNWPLKAVVSRPLVFSFNMEKKIVPRCNVIKALISKKLLGSELPSLSSVLSASDEVFLNRYVRKQEDKQLIAELMAILSGNQS